MKIWKFGKKHKNRGILKMFFGLFVFICFIIHTFVMIFSCILLKLRIYGYAHTASFHCIFSQQEENLNSILGRVDTIMICGFLR